MYLKTLGHPLTLHRSGGALVGGLRKKDLALLVYLCVEDAPVYARGRLAALLWETDERRARHSLTQALVRLRRALPPDTLALEKEVVRWGRGLPCDATRLLRGEVGPGEVDDDFSFYGGDFLEGFHPGRCPDDFGHWADRRRAQLRNAAMLLLECAGQDAEAARDWGRALRLAEREAQIDPLWEQGHRRLMRAMAARGERNRALSRYQALEEWLAEEIGADPDPETRALAEHLRDLDTPAGGMDPSPVPAAEPPSAPAPAGETEDQPDPATPPEPGADAAADPPPEPPGPPDAGAAERPRRWWWAGTRVAGWAVVLAVVLLVVWLLAVAESGSGGAAAEGFPGLSRDSPAWKEPRRKERTRRHDAPSASDA